MAGTRSSSRLANANSSPQSSQTNSPDNRKRKAPASASPQSKRGKKEQKTLDETMPEAVDAPDEDEMNEAAAAAEKTNGKEEATADAGGDNKESANGQTEESNAKNDTESKDEEQKDVKVQNGDGAVEESKERRDAMPGNILEKGIIYFFSRARVNIDEPKSVQDIARSYIVLRPLPHGAKLTDGPIDDLKNNRLLALPKKVLPKSGQDRFMTFVEKAGVSVDTLKQEFMAGSEYTTQSTGVSQAPPVTPFGEGVYCISTQGGRQTHLAYMLTIPSEIGEVQESMGIMQEASFVLSVKNPDQKGPANAALPTPPDFSKEIMEEFRGRRWMAPEPKHLDFANAQFLLIGEGSGDISKAVQPQEDDKNRDDKNEPQEEMEKLEAEDEERVKQLHEHDAIFHDLGVSKKDYPDLKSTW